MRRPESLEGTKVCIIGIGGFIEKPERDKFQDWSSGK